ncbi:MAG: hypothetical protein HYU39_05310 [Thaumarchaeota archaeon]|nr:hypothetical protein [Nitrososphaerota archaeon]
MNQLDDYNALADQMLTLDQKKVTERVRITGVSISTGNVLNITVLNDGGNIAHLVSLWVIDETPNPDTHTRYTVDKYVSMGGTTFVTGTATFGNIINLRLITELGNSISHRIAPASSANNLRMTLVADPPTVIGKHSVGISLTITNNNTSYDSLYNLKITPASDIAYTYSGTGETINLESPTVTSISSIRTGESALFHWEYEIALATPSQNFTFKGRYTGASTFATDVAQVVTPFGTGQESSLASVTGNIRIIFTSIQWHKRTPDTQTSGFSSWNSNWQVDKDDYLVIRVNMTNDATQNITLAEDTAIYTQRLDTGNYIPFYIVSYNSGTNTISTYNNVTLQANGANIVTVYFAVDNAGGNPNSKKQKFGNTGTYAGTIGIFGTAGTTPYGQSIPFQAFIATN